MAHRNHNPRRAIWILIACVIALGLVGWWLKNRQTPLTGDAADQAAARQDQQADAAPVASSSHPTLRPDGSHVTREEADPRDVSCRDDRLDQYRKLIAANDPKTSPEKAVTHAMLTQAQRWQEGNTRSVVPEIAAAVERWPDNVEVAWLAFNNCHERNGCDRATAFEHLKQVDGDNAYTWFHPMAVAREAKDQEAFAEAVHRAASAPIYDSRMGTAFLRLMPALASMPLPQSCVNSPALQDMAKTLGKPVDAALHANIEATAIESAVAMPGLTGLSGCSQQEGPLAKEVLESCRTLLSRMAEADTPLEQNIALSKLIELGSGDADTTNLRERYRRLQWLLSLSDEAHRIDGFAWRRFAEGEVNMMRDYAQQTGRWPPPKDWLPEGERARDLILGQEAPR